MFSVPIVSPGEDEVICIVSRSSSVEPAPIITLPPTRSVADGSLANVAPGATVIPPLNTLRDVSAPGAPNCRVPASTRVSPE